LLVISIASCNIVQADIFRWDNGEVIQGTEGVYAGPFVDLRNRQLECATLSTSNLLGTAFVGSNFQHARLDGSDLANADLLDTNLSNADLHMSWFSVKWNS
jgi:uncharacterized protein YjbI with pentapeptide repeats